MDDFFIRALIAGVGVALVAGPLGSLIVWNRMAFFGDALAHSAILGIALSFLFSVNPILGIITFATLFSFLITFLQRQGNFASDTLLSIIAHSALALGLIVVSLIPNLRIDLNAILFGDILSVTRTNIVWIYVGVVIVLLVLYKLWNSLVIITISKDIAKIEGINVEVTRMKFMLLVAIIIALSIKIVGILLVTSLLVIPAATTRIFAKNPEQMAFGSIIIAIFAIVGGLVSSLKIDLPSGPAIVVVAMLIFTISQLYILLRHKILSGK